MKRVAILLVTLLVVSSMGSVIAQEYNDNSSPTETLAEETFYENYTIDDHTSSENQINGLEIHNNSLYYSTYLEKSDGDSEITAYSRDLENESMEDGSPLTLADLDGQEESVNLGFTSMPKHGSGDEAIGDPERRIVFHSGIGDNDRLVNDGGETAELYSSKLDGSSYEVVSNNSNYWNISGYSHLELGNEEKIIYTVDKDWPSQTRMYDRETGETREIEDQSFLDDTNPGQVDTHVLSDSTFLYGTNNEAGQRWLYYDNETGDNSWFEPKVIGYSGEYVMLSAQEEGRFNDQILMYDEESLRDLLLPYPGGQMPDDQDYLDNADLKIPEPDNVDNFDRGFYQSGKYFFVDHSTSKPQMYVYDSDPVEHIGTISNAYGEEMNDPEDFEGYTKDGYIYYATFDENKISTHNTSVSTGGEIDSPFPDSENVSYNESLTDKEIAQEKLYADSGEGEWEADYPTGIDKKDDHIVIGTNHWQIAKWDIRPETTNDDNFESELNDSIENVPLNDRDAGDGSITVPMDTLAVYEKDDNNSDLLENVNAHYAYDKSGVSEDDNAGSLITTENGGQTVWERDTQWGEAGTAATTTINGKEVVVFQTKQNYDEGVLNTYLYDPEDGSTEMIANTTAGTANAESSMMEAYSPSDDEIITTDLDTQRSVIADRETDDYARIDDPVLAVANDYVVVATDGSIDLYNRETFVDNVVEDGFSSTIPERKIENPSGIEEFNRANYYGGYWFVGDLDSREMYAYDTDFESIEEGYSNAYGGSSEGTSDRHTKIEFYEKGGTIGYVHTGTKQGYANIYNRDTGLEPNAPQACGDYLQPQQLESLSEAPNVCWIPIYTGTWILESVYQWLVLALLISIPIAKVTRSDIATMVTIDSVLIIGMLIGDISPGYVAIAMVTTILLAVYGRHKTDVHISNFGDDSL